MLIGNTDPHSWPATIRTRPTRASFLETALLPVLSVGAAALGWLPLNTALWIAALSLVLTIATLALVATRRTSVRWPVKLLLFVVELAIALTVVGVKLLAH